MSTDVETDDGLLAAVAKMRADGVSEVAIGTFEDNYRRLRDGETGMVPESTIEPLASPALDTAAHSDDDGTRALDRTVVVKLNGGLATSMGMDRAKSLLEVKDGLSFLDIIARQVLELRRHRGVRLPLMFMDSYRTRDDTLEALEAYPELAGDLPLDFLQTKEPKLRLDDLTPVDWPRDRSLEWCPPGHGDIYGVLYDSGLLDTMIEQGFTQLFVSNADNLGAVPAPEVAAWFAGSGAPFAIEAVRRTPSDRKGGHFARRTSDGRIVLRETAQTLPEDKAALADLDRHRFASTNNIWIDLTALRDTLRSNGGRLRLPFIRNVKTVDPTDGDSPEVVQLETAMGSAIEVFDGAATVAVERNRFVPVKTTDDLLVLRSDCYVLDDEYVLHRTSEVLPYVELGTAYKFVGPFSERFPDGPPSLRQATALRVPGDWTFGADVTVIGDVTLEGDGGTIPPGTVLEG
jgi:UTP--glucose-1-phosphate uridylyltransferase